jgi:hypothetical protein
MRFRFSNAFGTQPVTFSAVTVALHLDVNIPLPADIHRPAGTGYVFLTSKNSRQRFF